MSNFANALYLGQITNGETASFADIRGRVQAVGVALLFGYCVNFILHGYVAFVKTEEGLERAKRRLLQTSQMMFWFGLATLFSMVPPFFYGVFNGVMSFLTLVVVIVLHLACFTGKKLGKRTLWSMMHFFYHLFIFIWIIVGLIMSYVWSQKVYQLRTA